MGDLLINKLNTLTAANSIGLRLSNTATIEQIGQQILTLNI
jgi:hypothetical protein